MNYRHADEIRKKRIRLTVLSIVVVLLFYYQHKIFPVFFGGVPARVAPILEGGAAIQNSAQNGFLSAFSFKSSLIDRNKELQSKLNEVEARVLDYDLLSAENAELKSLLGRPEREKFVLSAVMSKPGYSPYDTLLLDVGQNHGVSAGNKVLAYGSIVIGEIREVAATTAKAVLFSSPGEKYKASVSGLNIPLDLTGRGGGNFIAELPRDISITPGMQVYSVGVSPHLLGTVDSTSIDSREPLQKIVIKSPVNVNGLKSVVVVL